MEVLKIELLMKQAGITADELKEKLPFVGVIVKKDEDLEAVRRNV